MSIRGAGLNRVACWWVGGLLASACLLLAACEKTTWEGGYLETGDLPRIKKHGELRLLMPRQLEGQALTRHGYPADSWRKLAENFAHEMQLEPVVVHVESRDKLIPYLVDGKGDVIVANIVVTQKLRKKIAFTSPLTHVQGQIITRTGDSYLQNPADLEGRKIALQRSSPFWDTVAALQEDYERLAMETIPEGIDTDTILDRVARGEYDLTVLDSNVLEEVFTYRRAFRSPFPVTRDRLVAWAVRPDSRELRTALDRFLGRTRVGESTASTYHADFPEIKQRKVLRVLTRNNPATYFLWRGELVGFEYELVQEFAKQHGLQLEMIVPPTWGDLLTWLEQGRGDVVAASMTITEDRKAQGFWFSKPYNYVNEMVVARANEAIQSKEELAGRTVVVSRTTSYWQTLRRLQDTERISFTLLTAPAGLTTAQIIGKVATGEYDLTVADSHLLDLELTWRGDIKGAFALGQPVAHGWAVYAGKPKLLDAIDAFVDKTYRGTFYNIVYKKYFKNVRTARRHVERRAAKSGQLSPYDHHVREYAEHYGFDWRLIAAQMYQESRFDPKARSWAGAQGLLQVMPRTANQLGLTNLHDPAVGIHAGVKYLAWLRENFTGDMERTEQNWFTLAAYNAGYGHVNDARRLAAQLKLDPDRWFDNVEHAMLLLSKPKYYKQARYGYVRGRQPVTYVREIKQRYAAYVRAVAL
jgi:membrane-bound lytic murein transglycosylase F